MSSTNCTLGSMTQMSAPSMSRIWLVVFRIKPRKMDALLGDQQRGEGDAEDDAEILVPVAGQHLQCDPAHGDTSPVEGRFGEALTREPLPEAPLNPRTAARLKSAMWSASRSAS